MSDDEEYIVESIVTAHVKRQGRGKTWEYRVRWKGFTEKDDTWEPVKSFKGSEHFIETFWQRASKTLNGRDIEDLNVFKIGEEFFPIGPPLRKRKSRPAILKDTSPVASSSKQIETPMNNKRPRTPTPTILDEPSPKRSRQSVNPGAVRKPQKEMSVVPASEGEEDNEGETVNGSIISEAPPRFRRRSAENIGQSSLEDNEPQSKANSSVLSHGVRADPLVHLSDDSDGMKGARNPKTRISGKEKATSSKPSTSTPTVRRKPGPGRSSEGFRKSRNTSSLLTSDKGQLKIVKGKFLATEITGRRDEVGKAGEDVPVILDDETPELPLPLPPPTSAELLQLAIRDPKGGEELQAFEEVEEVATAPIPSNGPSSILQRSLSLARESLFPSSSVMSFAFAAFDKRPTIFGPLGSGSDVRPTTNTNETMNTQVVQTRPFSVTLDVTRKLSVILTDLSPNHAPALDKIVRNASGGPPGKFYSGKAALAILDTFRTSGASAKVLPAPNATECEAQDFQTFGERLDNSELFVLMVGIELLVFCSSSATLIAQRLNIPTALLSEPGSLLVERVSISNHSAYANAVLQANE
ncbi:hypothetical protein J3R30DRAFT_3400518 [Lentinula aciculospora]|uniref:Chromo domain-containing protein n=1 Tax=Lentinula aciculospora TaxID=153920 RepID=A0A9W9AQI5_9AGAR|nr:hypothetical protein J3R30DRAFT_3400518 [Lentinula aciculospora]